MNFSDIKAQDDEEGVDAFYISFGDVMVILSVFFAMLLSMSEIKTGTFEKIRTEMTGVSENTLLELSGTLDEIITEYPGIPGAEVEFAVDGIRLNFDTAVLFGTGSSILKKGALSQLDPLIEQIKKTNYVIDVEGHSDDQPYYQNIKGRIYSNWTLSGARASSMIHYLIDKGVDAQRLRVIAYAHVKPQVPYENLEGEALEEARTQNRRVSLLIR